jgi:hypothetical protein
MGLCEGASNGNAPAPKIASVNCRKSKHSSEQLGVFKDWTEIHDERLIWTFWVSFWIVNSIKSLE